MLLRAYVTQGNVINNVIGNRCKIKYDFAFTSLDTFVEEYISPLSSSDDNTKQAEASSLSRTLNSTTLEATIATYRGFQPVICQGDIVLVSIEENKLNQPSVVGLLFSADTDYSEESRNRLPNFYGNNLNILGTTTLSADTSIGPVKKENISNLENLSQNVESAFIALTKKLDEAATGFETIDSYFIQGEDIPEFLSK